MIHHHHHPIIQHHYHYHPINHPHHSMNHHHQQQQQQYQIILDVNVLFTLVLQLAYVVPSHHSHLGNLYVIII
jgi:hypothetical protein